METGSQQQSVTVAALKSLLAETPGSVLIVDVRNPDEYARQHIPVAVNIPVNELQDRLAELPAGTKIVTACGSGGNRCKVGAAKLRELGFTDAAFLSGGTVAWHEEQE
ncbi:MAG: rhodanese-like domain-containing protein [Chitinophagaceae bacterium]